MKRLALESDVEGRWCLMEEVGRWEGLNMYLNHYEGENNMRVELVKTK
jgi:hypothetical protein